VTGEQSAVLIFPINDAGQLANALTRTQFKANKAKDGSILGP
jgi:hypothetical protein